MEMLEAACVALHAPPTTAEAERKRSEAETVLSHFKRNPQALSESMSILQRTTQPLVQFHCVATLREVALTKWPALSERERAQPLDFLMQMLLRQAATLPKYVAAAMLQTVTLLLKRGWLDRDAHAQLAVVQQMGAMLKSGDGSASGVAMRLLAAKWMHAFVTEFASASKSSAMSQPVEFHTNARKALEANGLKDLVAAALSLLEDLVQMTTMCSSSSSSSTSSDGGHGSGGAGTQLDVPKEQLELLETAFLLCIEMLNWDFTDSTSNITWSMSAPVGGDKDDDNKTVITPHASWRDVLVRPQLIHAAFNTYAFFRNLSTHNESLLHLARQFLIQLASLKGEIFVSADEHVQFLAEIFRGATTVIHNPFLELIAPTDYVGYEIATREMIDMCQLLFRLVSNLGLPALFQAPGQLATTFLEQLSSLSCKLLQSALDKVRRHLQTSAGQRVDDLWQLEGIDVLLDAWVTLADDASLEASSSAPSSDAVAITELLSKYSAPVIELYLQTQLELSAVDALAEQDEDEEVEDESASSSTEQYAQAASLARLNTATSATLLMNLLQSFLGNVQTALAALGGRDEMTAELSQLFEKLHFTVQFTGLLLADDYESERPAIPVRIQSSMLAGNDQTIVGLLVLVMSQVLEFEATRVSQSPESNVVSPYFSEQLLATISRLCATYLSQESLVGAAPAVAQVFGFHTGGRGGELVNFLVQQSTVYLIYWPTQPVVMQHLMELLLVLSRTNAISVVLSTPFWQALVHANATASAYVMAAKYQGNDQLMTAVARIPASLRGQLAEALCRAGMTGDEATQQQHFAALVRPLEARLHAVISSPRFDSKEAVNDVRVQGEIQLILELYSGIARAVEVRSHRAISDFCLPALPVFVRVLHVFHGDSQIVCLTLNFFCSFVEAQICQLHPREAVQVFTACDQLTRVYCRHNLGRVSTLADAEEESYADLLALLKLLSFLVTKEFIDFSDHTASQQEVENASTMTADVVFAGVFQIIPMMTEKLLQYPSLSKQFFTLVSLLFEMYAEKVAAITTRLFAMLMSSLMFGLRHVQPEVNRYSFRAIEELAMFHWRAQQKNEAGLHARLEANPDLFVNFMRVILQIALFEDFNPIILDYCGVTLFPLVMIEQQRYFAIATEIAQAQPDELVRSRLMTAFRELTHFLADAPQQGPTHVASTRKNRALFKTNLYKFVAEARGFLQVK